MLSPSIKTANFRSFSMIAVYSQKSIPSIAFGPALPVISPWVGKRLGFVWAGIPGKFSFRFLFGIVVEQGKRMIFDDRDLFANQLLYVFDVYFFFGITETKSCRSEEHTSELQSRE